MNLLNITVKLLIAITSLPWWIGIVQVGGKLFFGEWVVDHVTADPFIFIMMMTLWSVFFGTLAAWLQEHIRKQVREAQVDRIRRGQYD